MSGIQYVVARYNEDINWILNSGVNYVIYNKAPINDISGAISLENVGREADTYLRHIIINYDNLANVTVFTQGRISDHFGENNIKKFAQMIEDCRKMGFSGNYHRFSKNHKYFGYNFNQRIKKILIENYKVPLKSVSNISFLDWFEENIEVSYPDMLNVYVAAIFAVDREHILSRPKVFYERLLESIEKINAPIEAHFFERSWFYVFNCYINNPLDYVSLEQ